MGLAQNPPAVFVPKDRLRETVDGTEKFCPRCDDWWPADSEFFWSTKGKLFYCCKACYHEMDRRPGRRGAADRSDDKVNTMVAQCALNNRKEQLA